jgi:hypothetical protein
MIFAYLMIESVRFGEIKDVDLNGLALCGPPPYVLAVNTEVEPLLMTSAVTVKAHEHIVLILTHFPHEVEISTLEIRIKDKLFTLILHLNCRQQIAIPCLVLLFASLVGIRIWQLKVEILVQYRRVILE